MDGDKARTFWLAKGELGGVVCVVRFDEADVENWVDLHSWREVETVGVRVRLG